MATVDLYQERENVNNGYRVFNDIVSATDIPEELFLYRFSDNEFMNVVALNDFNYPDTPTSGFDFYRQKTAERVFDNVRQALDFACHVKYRIENLVENFDSETDTFEGSETETYPTP